jgi:hypothetical protein
MTTKAIMAKMNELMPVFNLSKFVQEIEQCSSTEDPSALKLD